MTCSSCGATLPEAARFCPGCGATVEAEAAPEMLKLVSVLFADVVGSTARAETLHPEETRALMADYFQAMSDEIQAEGGTLEKFVGDAIMAVFGVPAAHEDDPVRAVRAARRMLARLERWNEGREHRLEIRIGINTGEVIAAGSPGRDLLVTGDAVNIAARLQQVAEPGQIAVGDRTARSVDRYFALRPLEPLELKGKAEPVEAWLVEGEVEAPEPRGVPGLQSPLVGRERQLELLRTTFANVREEHAPYLVTVLGDAGVGKSRLLREFVAALEVETKVAVGRCLSYGEGVTLWPLGEILKGEAVVLENDTPEVVREKIRALVAQAVPLDLARDPETTASALASTLGHSDEDADAQEAYRGLLRAWRALLAALADAQPLVVVVEDIHWADQTMLDVLDDLAEHVEGPVLFLCTARPDIFRIRPSWGGGKRNYSSVPLDPLSSDESARLVSLLLDVDELPADVKALILERAEGNPFFLEEIVRRLIDEGLVVHEDGRWRAHGSIGELEVPDNVQGVILARIDLLSPAERRVLQHAAVVGRFFWSGAVARLAPVEGLEEVLATLCRRELVDERLSSSMAGEVEYAFKHILIRDVAYESLPRRDRAAAHATAAAWIEEISGDRASDLAEFLAHHYDLAFTLGGEESFRKPARARYLAAAGNAGLRFAIGQCERFSRRAIELSRSSSERVEALETVADIRALPGDLRWQLFGEALEEAGDDLPAIARLAGKAAAIPARWRGTIQEEPPVEELLRLIERGLKAAGPGDTPERAILLASRAFVQVMGYEPLGPVGDAAAREALSIAERLDDADLISAALDAVGGLLLAEGRYADLRSLAARRVELVPRLGLPEVADTYSVAAWVAFHVGHYQEALDFATAGVEATARRIGAQLHGLTWRVEAQFVLGDWEGALADQERIERLTAEDPRDLPIGYTRHAYSTIAFCHELRGDTVAAKRYIELGKRYLPRSVERNRVWHAAIGRALAHQGLADEALSLFGYRRRSFASGRGLEGLCDIVAAAEDWQEAERVVALAREEAAECGLLALPFFADRLEGRMREDPALLGRSADGFAGLGAPWEEAWSRLLLTELTGDAGDLGDAVATFERLGSVAELDRANKVAGVFPSA